MSVQTTQPFHVREGSTSKLTAVIRDENETGIPAASLTTLTLTLYDQLTKLTLTTNYDLVPAAAIINSRNRQDVLNTNGCTIDGSGNLAMTFTPTDNVIVNTGKSTERHIALFAYTYAAGLKAGKEQVQIDVYNYAQTT